MNGKNLPPDKVEVSGEMGSHRATFAHHNSQPESVEVDTMNENQLKDLLEEAVSYRNPKDKESKSEIFKALLEKTEEEDEDRGGGFMWSNHKIEHKLSSLQNLSELNDHSDYRRQHNSRNSHKRMPTSSVSSRQREGGSLPSNVNVEHVDQTAPLFKNFKQTQQLLQLTTEKFGGGSSGGGSHFYNNTESHSYTTVTEHERELEQRHGEAKHLLANDCLAQNYESAGHLDNCCSQGTEMKKIPRLPTNYNNEMKIIDQQSKLRSLSPETRSIAMQHYGVVGAGVVEHHLGVAGSSGKTTLLEQPPFPLQNSNAVNSVFPQSLGHFPPGKCDENANHQPTTSGGHSYGSSGPSGPGGKKQKNKVPKSERNIVVVDPVTIHGFCGDKDIDSLLSYIENNDLKNGAASALLDAEKTRKREKAVKEKKETGKKLKKYSSLEELSTLSKTEQQQQHEAVNKMHSHNDTASVVVLRAPAKQLNSKKESVGLKEKKEKVVAPTVLPGKRRERRSWGTEELDFYAIGGSATVDTGNESDAELHTVIVHTPGTGPPPEKEKEKEKDKEKEKEKKEKKKQQQQQQPQHNELTLNKKKDSLSIVSIESISNSSETAEFHLVTNKKKTKKKSSASHDDNSAPLFRGGQQHQTAQQPYTNHRRDNNQQQHSYASTNNSSSASSTGSNARNKYPANNASAFANDRDIYMNHHHATNQQDKNNNHHHYHRRKSTSSVPPSDKSDSSDVDSVHSLPIGSTTKLSNKSGAQAPAQQTSSSGGSTPQAVSYADIAKFLNNNNNNNSANTNNGGNSGNNGNNSSSNNNNVVVDNWPTITSSTTITTTSSKTFSEQQQVDGYMPGPTSASNIVAAKQQQNVRTIKTSFPELVDNKNNLNNNMNSSSNSDILIINNKNTSSNSQNQSNLSNNSKAHSATTAKPSYSQSLIEDITPVVVTSQKSSGAIVVADHPATVTLNETVVNAPLATPTAHVTKNLLQKSKSVEHGFYSIEQYPALENTVVVPITNVAAVKPQKAVVTDATAANKAGKANSASGQQTNKQIEKQNNSKNAEMSRKAVKGEEAGDTKPGNGKKAKKEKLSAFQQTSDSNSFAAGVDTTSPTAPAPTLVNRPAVEILNYIETGSNEFTLSFGDFYENEIETLADDDVSPRPAHKPRDGTKSKSPSECSSTNNSQYAASATPTSTTTSPPAKHQLEISNVSHVSTQSDLGYASSTSPKQQQQQQQPATALKEMMHDNSIIAISNSSQTVIAAASIDASSSVNNSNMNSNSSSSSHMKATSNTKRKSMDQQRTLLPPPPHGVAENIVLVGGNHGVNIMVNSNYGGEPQMPTRFLQPPPNLMMGGNSVQQAAASLQHQYLPPQHIVLPVMMTMVPPPHIPPPTILQPLPASIVVPAGPIQPTPVQAPPPQPLTTAPPPLAPTGSGEERKLINFDEWNLRFVAPPQHPNPEFVSNNHDRIVDFVGCDWEKIMYGNVQYYDGQ